MAATAQTRRFSDTTDLAPVLALFEDRCPGSESSTPARDLLQSPSADRIRATAESTATVVVLDEAELGGLVTWLDRIVRVMHWLEGTDRRGSP